MKKSLAHLPGRKRDEIHIIIKKVLERLPETQMIILYGSYARGDYTEYDEKIEFGIPTVFMSDYDILVVTHGIKDFDAARKLDNVDNWYTMRYPDWSPVQLINDDIAKVNQDISDGRPFYNEVKKDGILLYDNGNFKLARRRKLRYDEIKKQAEEYYDKRYGYAKDFLRSAKYDYKDKVYHLAAFHLHQTCENCFTAVRLTFTLKGGKQHNLEKLLNIVRRHAPQEFLDIFPRQTKEEKRLFLLLKAAYVEGRYNPQFAVTKEDIEALMPIAQKLLDLTKRLCEERIKEYGEME